MIKPWKELEQERREIAVPVKYTLADLCDVVVGFWEGGISAQWIELATVNHPTFPEKPKEEPTSTWAFDALLNGGSVKIVSEEGVHTLTLEKLTHGFLQFLRGDTTCIIAGEVDAGQIDAIDADLVLQYAIFGKAVFG